MDNEITFSVVNNRITGENTLYYMNQLKEFCSWFDSEKVSNIHFGKQDIRGAPSITIYYKNSGCCSGFKYFSSMKELLEFVVGFNLAYNKENLKYTNINGLLKGGLI